MNDPLAKAPSQADNEARHQRTMLDSALLYNVPSHIREWWHLYPDANIGIATGKGLLVIDIDPQNGDGPTPEQGKLNNPG